jgi:ankyrin repeat protein
VPSVRSILKLDLTLFLSQDNEGQTPLHYACSCEQEDLIALLLKHKADVNIKDNSGESPLDINASIIESMMKSM